MPASSSTLDPNPPTIAAAVENFAGTLQPDAKVLDVGCGLKPYLGFLAPSNTQEWMS